MSAVGALVIGGDYRGLGIVRSLGRRLGAVHLVRTGSQSRFAHARPRSGYADERVVREAYLGVA